MAHRHARWCQKSKHGLCRRLCRRWLERTRSLDCSELKISERLVQRSPECPGMTRRALRGGKEEAAGAAASPAKLPSSQAADIRRRNAHMPREIHKPTLT